MKRTSLLIATLLCNLASAQQASFVGASPKPGQSYVRTASYKRNVDVILKFAGESFKEHNDVTTITVRKTETVLETNGNAITKLRVHYELIDRKTVITEDGIAENKKIDKSVVLARTYVVTSQTGAVKVMDANGFKPSEPEIEIVQGDYKGLGKPDGFLEFLSQKTVQVGEPLQMPGVLAEGMFTDADRRQVKVDTASFVLKALRQNVAVFDTALKMQWNEDANTSVKMNLTGETLVGIQNSRVISSTLGGTVRVTGTDQLYNRLVMVDGKGKITVTESLQIR